VKIKPKTLLAFAVDDLVDGMATLDDGWLADDNERAGMRQAAIAVINTALVAAAKPDRPPIVQAAYAAVLAFSYALGRAAMAKRVDPVAADTCREGLTGMLDALSPYLGSDEELRRAG
jgi:hypothetical protein